MKLRNRILVFSATQLFVVFAIIGGALAVVRLQMLPLLEERIEEETAGAAAVLGARLDMVMAAEQPERAGAVIGEIASDDDIARVDVYDAAGHLVHSYVAPRFATTRPSAIGPVPGEASDVGEFVVAWQPIVFEGIELGKVVVSCSVWKVDRMAGWMTAICLIGVGLVVIAVIVSLRLTTAFVAPLREIVDFARAVAQGRLGERLRCSARGELADLAANMNWMTERIERRGAALATRHIDLERSLKELQRAQADLMTSTRLASIGEVSGRVAHEVLNPVTSIYGRIALLLREADGAEERSLTALDDIVGAWRRAFADGGVAGLVAALEAPAEPSADGSPRSLIAEDLDVLGEVERYLAAASVGRRADLRFLLAEIDRVTHILDGMRVLARPSSSPADIRLGEVVDHAIQIARDDAAKLGVQLIASGDLDATVHVDRYELIQVLTNLVRNALQAIEEARGRAGGRIELRVTLDDLDVALRVIDDGAGIDPENVPRLFESNFTTRSAASGTGLGLSLSRRLVRGADGELSLERSIKGDGTTFLITLPRFEYSRPDKEPRRAA